ncbi:MAG: LytTR family DNA-binding domain-containing protein [Candidatus Kapabacteria bacterium]|jgi:DNA-binding LytR/AlgR family response regulator|nr:LytTR family DNA-binding domain-containing protein [Candidatus Kapabacteria bacterium]
MKSTCIIIEDEPLALERTKGYVAKTPTLHLLATFDNALDAFAFLKANTVDILFLDINLGAMSGLQLLESMRLSSQIILTTAYSEYAIKGFDLNVTDYLLKPFPFERFLQAVDKAHNGLQTKSQGGLQPTTADAPQASVFIKTEHRLENVQFSDLLYIEGMSDYRKLHLAGKSIMTLQTFSELEQMIPPNVACRVHKSYMVALNKIESIERDRILLRGAGKVIIPISETYKEQFFSRIRS